MAYETEHGAARGLFRGTQIVWYIFYIIEALLLFRFVLKLIGANPGAGFTNLIYTLSYPFAAPFLYVINATRAGGVVFEWTTLIALLVYWMIALGLVRLFAIGRPVTTSEAEYKLRKQDLV